MSINFVHLTCIRVFIECDVNRKPENWNISWSGSGMIYGWGHNHRGQLGGVGGNQVKVPTPCEALTALRPVQLAGGEQSLFAVTSEGRVYATGEYFFTSVL